MSAMEHRAVFELAPEAPSRARAVVNAELGSAVSAKVLEDATLLVSELVTNSVRHAELGPDDTIAVRVLTKPTALRVEVADPGPGFDPSAVGAPNEEGGWGLWLLDRIATRWGTSDDDRAGVWFELDAVSR